MIRLPLFEGLPTDEHGKLIAWQSGDYLISVNSETDATYIALYCKGQKVGDIETRNFGKLPYKALGVNMIHVGNKHRGEGYAAKMYVALVTHMNRKYDYICAYKPEIVNQKMKKYWKKYATIDQDDFYYIPWKKLYDKF